METFVTLAFALVLAGDPDQPYARSARMAQHHDTSARLDLGPGMFDNFRGSPGAEACRTQRRDGALLRWDALAGRWLYTRPARDTRMAYQCTAVSVTTDVGGAYHRYVFEARFANGAPAYAGAAQVATWPDAYYFSTMLEGAGAQACGYDRAAMLEGRAAEARCIDFPASSGPVLPAEMTGESMLLWRFYFTTHTLTAPFFVRVPRLRTCTSG